MIDLNRQWENRSAAASKKTATPAGVDEVLSVAGAHSRLA